MENQEMEEINEMDDVKKRYEEKTRELGLDPYSLNFKTLASNNYPDVTYIDLVNYLLYKTSTYTNEQFKNFKSLLAYNFFACGWVKDVRGMTFSNGNKWLLIGKVMHSQRLNESYLTPWIICEKDGQIESGHCDCMAGASETCSHVGAVLFFLEFVNRKKNDKSVTEQLCYWKGTSKTKFKENLYGQAKDIDFTSGKRKWINLGETSAKKDSDLNNNKNSGTTVNVMGGEKKKKTEIPALTQDEIKALLTKYQNDSKSNDSDKDEDGNKNQKICALMTILSPFNDHILRLHNSLPRSLPEIFRYNSVKNLPLNELVALSFKISFRLTEKDCKSIELSTRGQSNNVKWFRYRAGRITASNLHAVGHTRTYKPSISLLRKICYPFECQFSSKEVVWGRKHEKTALDEYVEKTSKVHNNFIFSGLIGLFIDPNNSHLAASPDAIVSCDCCGQGCVEIKCPYTLISMSLEEAKKKKNFFIDENDRLKEDHPYFIQVQAQMFITKRKYCDFVVWSPDKNEKLFCQRIYPDNFIMEKYWFLASEFFSKCVVPELLAEYWTATTKNAKSAN